MLILILFIELLYESITSLLNYIIFINQGRYLGLSIMNSKTNMFTSLSLKDYMEMWTH